MPDDEDHDDVDGVRHGPVPVEAPATMLTQRLKGTREAFRDDRDEPIKSDLSRAAVVVTAVVHATWSRTVRRSALTSR